MTTPNINLTPLIGIALILLVLLMIAPAPARFLVDVPKDDVCKSLARQSKLTLKQRDILRRCPNE